jgi:high-affinity Fe2+/Pb2+ permease
MKAFLAKRNEVVKITGYVILSVSCILFILIPVVPFTGLSAAKVAAVSAGLLISGEVLFYLSLVFLGKSFLERIKGWIKIRRTRSKDPDFSQES